MKKIFSFIITFLRKKVNKKLEPATVFRVAGLGFQADFSKSSTFKVDKFLEHGIGYCDNTGVSLIASLCDDHIREFLRKVNVRHFERALDNFAGAVLAADLYLCLTGSERRSPDRTAQDLWGSRMSRCRYDRGEEVRVQRDGRR